jgi:hypothetical protein
METRHIEMWQRQVEPKTWLVDMWQIDIWHVNTWPSVGGTYHCWEINLLHNLWLLFGRY